MCGENGEMLCVGGAYRVGYSIDRVYVHFFGTPQKNEPKKACTRGSAPL